MARVRFLDQVPVGFYELGTTGGGGGNPSGPFGSIQYNNNGSFGGNSNLSWSPNTNTLTIAGTLTATSITGSLYGTSSWSVNSISSSYSNNIKLNGGNYEILYISGSMLSSSPGFLYKYENNGLENGIVVEAIGSNSHAEGASTSAVGFSSHAEGSGTQAVGDYSHAEGASTSANGDYSHAEGFNTTAGGDYSHAEGFGTTADGYYSHAEGLNTVASKFYSHAEGADTQANGYASHAEGSGSSANGDYSHAEGLNTIASSDYQHAQGTYNLAVSGAGAFILGNGISGSRSNLIFASGSLVQVTGSIIATQGFTGSLQGTSSWASNALTASFLPVGTYNITSSWANRALTASYAINAFPYTGSAAITGSLSVTGSVGVTGSLQADTITGLTSVFGDTVTGTSINANGLLSFDRMTSLKSFVTITTNNVQQLISYKSSDYFGVAIDAVAYLTGYGPYIDETVLFRLSLVNTVTKKGEPTLEVLSATANPSSNLIIYFSNNVVPEAELIGGNININLRNRMSEDINIRPMYRLVKQCLTT